MHRVSNNPMRTSFCAVVLTILFSAAAFAQQPVAGKQSADSPISLSQYRQWYSDARTAALPQPKKGAPPLPPVDLRPADEAFLQVLTLQARVAAARQSQDRLAGWLVAIKPQIENQSIAALDVEVLTLAERTAGAEVSRLESRSEEHTSELSHT